jgi:Mg/Co/Ni transporter MgtE
LTSEDVAETICEMGAAEQRDALHDMSPRERAGVLCALSASELAGLSNCIEAQAFAQSLLEMQCQSDRGRAVCALGPQERGALLVALPAHERAGVLSLMIPSAEELPEQCAMGTAAGWGRTSSGGGDRGTGGLGSSGRHAEALMKTLVAMEPAFLAQVLAGMSSAECAVVLLCMPDAHRADVLQAMGATHAAGNLNEFLLEDRAATLRAMDRYGCCRHWSVVAMRTCVVCACMHRCMYLQACVRAV